MEPFKDSGLIGFFANYNPFTRDGNNSTEAEQMLINGAIWSAVPAYCETFIESVEGKFVLSAFALGVIEQFAENRIKVENSVVRRFVPLVTSACILGGTFFILTEGNPQEYSSVAAVTAISALTLSAIKAVSNKPYPPIMPTVRKLASYLPIIGHRFQEKTKLF
ncbi:MAG: hypothetical protein LLF94_07425 [Chlamydiales bacterium]|nr:hypothetical protein [Chlamydiales bacterium]